MLLAYQTQTQRLLQNPASPTSLYALSDINSWINTARNQIAGESVSIRVTGSISTISQQVQYNFSGINIGIPATTGIQSVLHISNIRYVSGNGTRWIETRPWPWFSFYHLNNPAPGPVDPVTGTIGGPPVTWAQYGQGADGGTTGSGATGTFYIDPIPNDVYTLQPDCICLPRTLATDGDIEALPYPWTDCVPYLAAWYALLSSQTNARIADAERMFNFYEEFKERARKFANPDLLRWQYSQGADVAQGPKFGIKPGAPSGGGA